jgi:hypothetical protein
MAFGLLKTKWHLLKQPFGMSLHISAEVLMFMSHLHNFCINMESSDLRRKQESKEMTSKQESEEIILADVSMVGCGYPPTVETLVPHG